MDLSRIHSGANEYAASMGNKRLASFNNVVIAPQHQQHLASLYAAAPEFDPRALPAFKAMREETGRQFDLLTKPVSRGGLGIDVQVHQTDPYSASRTAEDPMAVRRMFEDVANGRMHVLSTAATGGHPLFSNAENDAFRAVHDVFGHVATGRSFDRHGEEAAYQSHAAMYSPLARQALATETRGQNAAMITSRGAFQPQKIALLPGATRRLAAIDPLQRVKLMKQAAEFHRNAGLG